AGRHRALARRTLRPYEALPAPALRRAGAAGRDRARHRHRPDPPPVRRAHRRSRPQGRGRDPRPPPSAQPRAREDRDHGHARSARRRTRRARPQPGEGCAGRSRGMKFWPLLWSNLKRRKARTIFTLMSIVVAFILFAYLAAVRIAFSAGVEVAGADRLMTTHKVSIIQPLPKSYEDQIARTPGVVLVTHASWFGGIYQDPNKGFQGVPQFPVDPDS